MKRKNATEHKSPFMGLIWRRDREFDEGTYTVEAAAEFLPTTRGFAASPKTIGWRHFLTVKENLALIAKSLE